MLKKIQEFIKDNYIFLIIGAIAGLFPFFINNNLVEIIEFIFGMLGLLFVLFITILLIINIIKKKKRRKRVDTNDYYEIKAFCDNILKPNIPTDDYYWAELCDYLYTIVELCESFLNGSKKLYVSKSEIVEDSNDIEINTEIKKLDFLALNDEIKKIIEIIYKYYDSDGVWKKYEKEK